MTNDSSVENHRSANWPPLQDRGERPKHSTEPRIGSHLWPFRLALRDEVVALGSVGARLSIVFLDLVEGIFPVPRHLEEIEWQSSTAEDMFESV
jgi:hypothetical protein